MTATILTIIGAILLIAALTFGYFAWVTWRVARRAERAVPASGRFVSVGPDRIHYVEQGEGRPIVFVHGLGGQLHHFRHPLFAELQGEFRVIAMDRTGSGYSTRNGSGARIPEQAAILAGFIDALGLERPLVVGHSLGGAIALAAALNHPEKIGGLALIAPLTHMVPAAPAEFAGLNIRSPALRRFIAHTIAVPMSIRHAKATLDFVFGPQAAPADYIVEGGGMLGLRPGQFYAISTDLVEVARDLEAQQSRYGGLSMPVGVLFGDRDRVLDHRRHGIALKEAAPGVELEIVEGIGHMPQYACTQRVVDFIRRMAGRVHRGGV